MAWFPKAVMHPHFKWVVALVVLIILFFFFFRGEGPTPAEPVPPPENPETSTESRQSAHLGDAPTGVKEDLSANYLEGYGAGEARPEQDLVLVNDVIEAFIYSVKVPDALPTEGNREIVQALLGENPYRIRFLAPGFRYLSQGGELVDRWGTPLYFHFVETTEVGIRSAGPDRAMWTDDDLRHGEASEELL